jgi:hypothetical protein
MARRLPHTGGNDGWARFAAGDEGRRNRDPIEKRILEVDDELRGPDLPADVLPHGEDWHPRTVPWWDTWRRSALGPGVHRHGSRYYEGDQDLPQGPSQPGSVQELPEDGSGADVL